MALWHPMAVGDLHAVTGLRGCVLRGDFFARLTWAMPLGISWEDRGIQCYFMVFPIGSMCAAIYGDIYHQYIPNVSIFLPAPWILWYFHGKWIRFHGFLLGIFGDAGWWSSHYWSSHGIPEWLDGAPVR